MSSYFLDDEEMGKKDDDYPSKKKSRQSTVSSWKATRIPQRKILRRLGILILVSILAYVFVKNIPTDLEIRDRRRPVYPGPKSQPGIIQPLPPGNAHRPPNSPRPPKSNSDIETPPATIKQDYSGVLRFLNLAPTLQAIAGTQGSEPKNKNVLFASSSLETMEQLLPIACQMGMELRSYVHFALMGRNDITIQDFQETSGIDDSCHIIFHDARPDNAISSTQERFERSVVRALYHINIYMHPQAIIVASDPEDITFVKAIREGARQLNIANTVIEVPANTEDRLAWMTRLDSSSLAAWNKMTVDILVHAHAGSSGGLMRLLESLRAADYTSCSIPQLTIELPETIDPPLAKYLETFQWPPRDIFDPKNTRQITLRHRIIMRGISEEESSVRFLESFYPADSVHSHALVLSPDVELSREFFHYLKYTMLEYRYSNNALFQAYDQRLFGISLDLPSTHLNGSGSFVPPSGLEDSEVPGASSPFLWLAPNSNAVLISGTKWIELHGFVSHLLDAQNGVKTLPGLLAEKVVSKNYPAWLELALRLCRARGYWTLYPSKPTASNLATVHQDMHRVPEEYEKDAKSNGPQDNSGELALQRGTLLNSLPGTGSLMRFSDMPLLSWDGTQTTLEDMNEDSLIYAAKFKRTFGDCWAKMLPPQPNAKDLFCIYDEDDDT